MISDQPLWYEAFLILYERTGCKLKIACERAGIARSKVYRHLEREDFRALVLAVERRVAEKHAKQASAKQIAA